MSSTAVLAQEYTENPLISVQHVFKWYGAVRKKNAVEVLSDINLDIQQGDFLVLIGKSGCGKSTLLSILAGLIRPSRGSILVGGSRIRKAGKDRGIIFQDADEALFSWLTVWQNVEYGLKVQKVDKERRAEIALKYINLVGLSSHKDKYPDELSGGMKQRLQIARALATDPGILIMDEPFGALDAQTRRILQNELIEIWKQTKKTIIFVTHDIAEAVLLGEKISIMSMSPKATIYKTYDVALSYPRDERDDRFLNLKDELQGYFDGSKADLAG
ncbi:MAG: ABC transporter ATP-binding protein [Lachnospiraceae bacterium]|nr:ABC transporter ATP-binding protein [Lachnospiraceae bacterium]